MKAVIFLTGTIKPGNVPNLKRVDPLTREKDYYYAIKKWLLLGFPLVFVENSNYSSDLIDSLFKEYEKCEYIKFDSKVSHLGKSHGEAEIFEHAFYFSKIINECDIIIKSSGRQYIENATKIFKGINAEDAYVISWLKRYLQYADSRFFIAYKEFYIKYLLPELHKVDELNTVYVEHILARAIHKAIAEGKQWKLPSEYPVCEGISGTDDFKYKTSLYSRLKGNIIIRLTNRLLKNDYL